MYNSTDLSYLELNGKTIGYILMTINIIIIFPIVIGNMFVLIAYKNTPKLHAPINLLLVNLALTDLCTGLCSIPWTILVLYLKLGLGREKYACLLGFASRHIPLAVSCVTMFFIGIVRAISVFNPLKSRIWITHKRIRLLMFFIWLYVFLWICGTLYLYQDWSPNKPCHIKVVIGMPYNAIQGAHIIFVGIASTAFYISFINFIRKYTNENATYADRADKDHENRKTKMVMSTVGCYYACWSPALLYIIIRLILFGNSPEETNWGNIFEHFTLFIICCNSFMNPFIYAGYNPTFRSVFQRYINTMICVKRKTSKSYRIAHLPEPVNATLNIDSFSDHASFDTS